MRLSRGFTIVELIVVIVVIAILASITLVMYNGIQKRAMDTKIRTTIDDVGKALLIEELNGVTPGSSGYWQNTNGVDSVVVPTYVPADYRDDLTSTNVNFNSRMFRYYRCDKGFALYASLNKPSDEDKTHLSSIKSQCGHSDTHVPESGALKYNYGKFFS